jgi:hypothetical protein
MKQSLRVVKTYKISAPNAPVYIIDNMEGFRKLVSRLVFNALVIDIILSLYITHAKSFRPANK